MRIAFNDGTLFLEDAPETAPYAEWDDPVNEDDPVDEYRACAHHYRDLRAWVGKPTGVQLWTRQWRQLRQSMMRRVRTRNFTSPLQYPSTHTTISTDV